MSARSQRGRSRASTTSNQEDSDINESGDDSGEEVVQSSEAPSDLSRSGSDEELAKDPSYNEAYGVEVASAVQLNRTPNIRIQRDSSISVARKEKARKSDPNKGRCLLTWELDPSPAIQAAHVLPRGGLTEDQLTALEWAWGMKYWTLHADTSKNIIFLRSDLHLAFDNDFWFLVPIQKEMRPIYTKVMKLNTPRSPITNSYDNKKIFRYHLVPLMKMSNVIIPRRLEQEDIFAQADKKHLTYYYPYQNFPVIKSHVHPHFVIFNAGQKLMGSTPKMTLHLPPFILEILPLVQGLHALWMQSPPSGFATGTLTTKRGAPSNADDEEPGDHQEEKPPRRKSKLSRTHTSESYTSELQEGDTGHGQQHTPAMDMDDDDESEDEDDSEDDDENDTHDDYYDYATWKESLTQWKKQASDAATSEGGWEDDVFNDAQIGAYVDEQPRSPRKEPWETWRAPWMNRGGYKPPPDTRTFSSNDWALFHHCNYLSHDSTPWSPVA